MKLLGLVIAVLGWLLAIMSVKLASPPAQIICALAGFTVALIGVLGVLNAAHLKDAIWKS
ncbi:MAG: hypothetical protein IVW54_11355 [Candidatus Binataceae bacterium]|nr:hypothetical protein [Candidatus Binataceae bacterium]